MSGPVFSWEGFCPPPFFHGRDFVSPCLFIGGFSSAPYENDGRVFIREGFCPYSEGKYSLVYAHPEAFLSISIGTVILSAFERDINVSCIAFD